jgi:F0F1-type ATP synthase membrane subunit c/vacuolar-type H+-ATPase subunit K
MSRVLKRLINFLIGILGGGVHLGPLGTAATNGLLRQPRLIMMMEKLME